MPLYANYFVRATTTVVVTTTDGKKIADFTIETHGTANSDTKPLDRGINDTIIASFDSVTHYVEAVCKCETERLSKI
jgi:hypothetical protein